MARQIPCAGKMKADCELNVRAICSPVPKHGLPSSAHGPKIFSARLTRAAFGAQPVQSEVTAFVADVYAAIAGGQPDGLPTFADGLRAAVLTDAVLDSAARDTWVEVPA